MTENSRDLFDLAGRVAIVTGGSRGIGEAMAGALSEFGARVVITSRKQEGADEAAHRLSQAGHDVLPVACHSGNEDQLRHLVETTIRHFGKTDILVNNAATNPAYGPIEDMSGDLFDKIMSVNVRAAFTLSNLCLPIMKKQGRGSVIHISSVEGIKPSPGLGIYSVSKAALIMLSKTQAREWGAYNIRSNVICPGLVQTKFSSALWANKEVLEYWNQKIPLQRIAQPQEMTGLAVFLASDASSYCTGMEFTADGGYMIS